MSAQAKEEASKIAKTIDQDPHAKTAAAGILEPIYQVAEFLAFPAFHWLAFALMASGVVSFALQLVLGKLVVLARMGFSLKEIHSDAISLLISVVGLVLTTRRAAGKFEFHSKSCRGHLGNGGGRMGESFCIDGASHRNSKRWQVARERRRAEEIVDAVREHRLGRATLPRSREVGTRID